MRHRIPSFFTSQIDELPRKRVVIARNNPAENFKGVRFTKTRRAVVDVLLPVLARARFVRRPVFSRILMVHDVKVFVEHIDRSVPLWLLADAGTSASSIEEHRSAKCEALILRGGAYRGFPVSRGHGMMKVRVSGREGEE